MLKFSSDIKPFLISDNRIGQYQFEKPIDFKRKKTPFASRGKILVVDDNLMHAETVKLYLENSGYSVYHSPDITTAWGVMIEEKPDLVILDVVMPGENGLDLLSRIKAHYPDTGVIIMTAYGSEDIASLALKLGAVDYIKKPFKYSSLIDIVGEVLARQSKLKSDQRAVQSLQHAYEELQVSADSILRCMSSGVVAVDKDLRVRIINEKGEEILGKQNKDVIGKRLYETFPELAEFGLLKTTLKNGSGLRHVEIEWPGTGRIFSINTAVIHDFRAHIIGAVAVFDDITEIRRKEQMLKERDRLAIIGQMAAGMAHELKNPLTSIRGFAQILSGKPLEPEIKGCLEIMVSETGRMNKVIQDFLQLSRPKPPEFKKVSLNSILNEVLPIIEPQAFLKNVQVRVATDPSIPPALMDPDQIKQVLLNLVQNAIEAMEDGGTLAVETAFMPGTNEICLSVSDTGCGVSQDKLKQLSIPFYTTKAEGTGLGLSISSSIVDLHQGRTEVRSREGQGTTFNVFLPVMD